MSQDRYETSFGEPPPIYPTKIRAVRFSGEVVSGDSAKGNPDDLTFDITIRTRDGEIEVDDAKSHYPNPPGDLDVDASQMVGATVWSWIIPEENLIVPMIPLFVQSVECE